MNNAETKTEAGNHLTVNDVTFREQVLESSLPVLVDFWAAWCGPCRMMTPIVEELATSYAGRAKVLKLDVDANPETAAQFGITGLPTLLVFKQGQVVDRVIGATSRKVLASKLDAYTS